jgi:hypothetical protein
MPPKKKAAATATNIGVVSERCYRETLSEAVGAAEQGLELARANRRPIAEQKQAERLVKLLHKVSEKRPRPVCASPRRAAGGGSRKGSGKREAATKVTAVSRG